MEGSPRVNQVSVKPDGPTRAAVQTELGRKGLLFGFSPTLEHAFESDTGTARIRHLITAGILAMVLPNFFLVADVQLVPDMVPFALLLHGGCTIVYSLVLFYTARNPPPQLREAAHGLCLTAALLNTVALMAGSHAPDRAYLCVTFPLFILYVNVGMRLRLAWCLVFNATGTLVAAAAVLVLHAMPPGVREVMFLSVVTAAAFTLHANIMMEAAERRSWLLTLDLRLCAEELTGTNARLAALSTTDWLTGISNRRGLELRLAELWQSCAAQGQVLSLLMIDVDHFKLYNDLHGHPAGDACLKRLALLTTQLLRRKSDHLGRYGGEEFAVILPHTDEVDAARAAERIRQAVEDLSVPHGTASASPFVTVSIGAAAAEPASGGSPELLLAAADRALYTCKQRGRNRVHPAPPATVTHQARGEFIGERPTF